MLKNNLIAFGIHIIDMLACILLFKCRVPAAIIFAASMLLYVVLGRLLLTMLPSAPRNLVSVSAVSLAGLAIGIMCLIFPGSMGFNWFFYLIYHTYSFALADVVSISPEPAVMVWLFPLPSLLIWLGLQAKSIRIRT